MLNLTEEESMLVQLLVALVGEAVFGAITARHRGFQAEMERCVEEGSVAPLRKAPPSPER